MERGLKLGHILRHTFSSDPIQDAPPSLLHTAYTLPQTALQSEPFGTNE